MDVRTTDSGHGGTDSAQASLCLNCGAVLAGPFCHQCGQHAHVHRTLGAFWHDLLHGVLHFEGKIWHTLPMLAWRPGELTRRYIAGERQRFVSPLALFLFSVFLMFAVFSAIGGPIALDPTDPDVRTGRAETTANFEREQAQNEEALRRLQTERAALVRAGRPTAQVDARIGDLEREIASRRLIYEQAMKLIPADPEAGAPEPPADEAGPEEAAPEEASDVVLIEGADGANNWFNQAYQKAKKNPSLLFYKVQTNAYKFSWALIPISTPFLWLLFLHRRRYRQYRAYDHVVFITYSIAFMSLGLIVLTLLRPLGMPASAAILAMSLIPPVHIYRQLRGAYLLSRFSALWRTVVLIQFCFIAITLFSFILLTLGVLG